MQSSFYSLSLQCQKYIFKVLILGAVWIPLLTLISVNEFCWGGFCNAAFTSWSYDAAKLWQCDTWCLTSVTLRFCDAFQPWCCDSQSILKDDDYYQASFDISATHSMFLCPLFLLCDDVLTDSSKGCKNLPTSSLIYGPLLTTLFNGAMLLGNIWSPSTSCLLASDT